MIPLECQIKKPTKYNRIVHQIIRNTLLVPYKCVCDGIGAQLLDFKEVDGMTKKWQTLSRLTHKAMHDAQAMRQQFQGSGKSTTQSITEKKQSAGELSYTESWWTQKFPGKLAVIQGIREIGKGLKSLNIKTMSQIHSLENGCIGQRHGSDDLYFYGLAAIPWVRLVHQKQGDDTEIKLEWGAIALPQAKAQTLGGITVVQMGQAKAFKLGERQTLCWVRETL